MQIGRKIKKLLAIIQSICSIVEYWSLDRLVAGGISFSRALTPQFSEPKKLWYAKLIRTISSRRWGKPRANRTKNKKVISDYSINLFNRRILVARLLGRRGISFSRALTPQFSEPKKVCYAKLIRTISSRRWGKPRANRTKNKKVFSDYSINLFNRRILVTRSLGRRGYKL